MKNLIGIFAILVSLSACEFDRSLLGEKRVNSEWDYAYSKWDVCPHRRIERAYHTNGSTELIAEPGDTDTGVISVDDNSRYVHKVTFRLRTLHDSTYPVLAEVVYRTTGEPELRIDVPCTKTKPGTPTEDREYVCEVPRERVRGHSFALDSFSLQNEKELGKPGAKSRYRKVFLFPPCASLTRTELASVGKEKVWLNGTEVPNLGD